MRIEAARFRHRIALERDGLTPAADGGLTEGITTLDTVWAEVLPIAGGKVIAGRQVQEVATHRITIRHRADWRDVQTIKHGASRLTVRAARDVEERRQIVEFLCEEIRTDA